MAEVARPRGGADYNGSPIAHNHDEAYGRNLYSELGGGDSDVERMYARFKELNQGAQLVREQQHFHRAQFQRLELERHSDMERVLAQVGQQLRENSHEAQIHVDAGPLQQIQQFMVTNDQRQLQWEQCQRLEQELCQLECELRRLEEAIFEAYQRREYGEISQSGREEFLDNESGGEILRTRLYQRPWERPYSPLDGFLIRLGLGQNIGPNQNGRLGNIGGLGNYGNTYGLQNMPGDRGSGGGLISRYGSRGGQRHNVEAIMRALGTGIPSNMPMPGDRLPPALSPPTGSAMSGASSEAAIASTSSLWLPAKLENRARAGRTSDNRPAPHASPPATQNCPPSQHDPPTRDPSTRDPSTRDLPTRDFPTREPSPPPSRDPARRIYSTTTIGWLTALLTPPMILTLGAAFILGFLEANPTFESPFPPWLTSAFLYSANSALTIMLNTYYTLSVTLNERPRGRERGRMREGSFVMAMLCSAFIFLLAIGSIIIAFYSQNGSSCVLGITGAFLSYLIYLGMVLKNEKNV